MITVQLPTDPGYWGLDGLPQQIEELLGNIEAMVRAEFRDAPFEIRFERVWEPCGDGVHGDDLEACRAVWEFIADNCQFAY